MSKPKHGGLRFKGIMPIWRLLEFQRRHLESCKTRVPGTGLEGADKVAKKAQKPKPGIKLNGLRITQQDFPIYEIFGFRPGQLRLSPQVGQSEPIS